MRRLILSAVALGAVTVAAPARADWFYSRSEAQSISREYVSEKYEMPRRTIVARCRPQGRASAQSGYEYHSWVCGWATEDYCKGAVVVRGSDRGRGWYRAFVWRGINC